MSATGKASKSGMPKKPEMFKPEDVAEALRVNHGNASAAARVLQCHPDTIRAYCSKYPEVKAARESGTEVRLDVAEAALDRAVQKGEAWAVCFLLKTRGKSRGYIERQEIDHAGSIDFRPKAIGRRENLESIDGSDS